MDAEQLEMLQSILASLDDLVFVLDAKGVFLDVHCSKDARLLLPPGEFIGKRYNDVLPVQSSVYLKRALKAIEAGNRMQEFDYSIVFDGRETFWSAKVTRRLDRDGNYAGATVLCREITERKQHAALIDRLNSTLEMRQVMRAHLPSEPSNLGFLDIFDLDEIQKIQDAFAEATGVASIITDVDGRPITKPSSFCRLCKDIIRNTAKGVANCYYSDAVIGRMHPDGPVLQRCLSGGLFDGGTSIHVEHRHIANWLIGQVRDSSVSDEDLMRYAKEIGANEQDYREALRSVPVMPVEKFAKVCKALHLIGDQLSRLAYQNVQQARFIAERKHLETQLRQAQKLEAVGQLAGGIAHDFNNILTAQVLQFAMLAQRTDLPDDVLQTIESLHNSARSAAGLTRQLLAFSRKQILQTRVLDMNLLVGNFLKLLKRMLREDIELAFVPATRPAPVRADQVMMEQVLMNLVVNARDAITSNGRVSIKIERDDSMKVIRMEVADNGCGMDETMLTHIFEPFFTTKDKTRGTGLGLATVYGIIRQHEGAIEVDSKPGCGTCFRIALPLSGEVAVDEPSAPVPYSVQPACSGALILLVEDEPSVREVLRKGLQRMGYRTLEAENAEGALKIWEKERDHIGVVLTDMIMPGELSGLELARKLMTLKPDLRVILASGYSSELAEIGDRERESLHFLQKPYELHQLAALVGRLLKQE